MSAAGDITRPLEEAGHQASPAHWLLSADCDTREMETGVFCDHQNICLDAACAREPCLGSLLSNITWDTRIRTKIETQTCLDKTKILLLTLAWILNLLDVPAFKKCFIYSICADFLVIRFKANQNKSVASILQSNPFIIPRTWSCLDTFNARQQFITKKICK